ncbi:MAG: cation:proton antiporter [Pseudomonadales bacterium]
MSFVEERVIFAVALFLAMIAARPVAGWTRLPESVVLVLLGAVGGVLVTQLLNLDTGIRATSFHDLIFFVFLPILIFEAAIQLPQVLLQRNYSFVLFLSIVGVVLTTGIAAICIYWGIGHPSGFPWVAALLTGALLSATDPVAVVAQLKTLGAPERLGLLLEGESLFNDATAIALFGVLLAAALSTNAELDALEALLEFARIFFLGAFSGAAIGVLGAFLLRQNMPTGSAIVTSLAIAYGSFIVAEVVLHASGVMAVLVAGLIVARMRTEQMQSTHVVWQSLSYLANGCVFLLMGLTITVGMFEQRWLAMLIAIGAILIARATTTYLGIASLNLLATEPVDSKYQTAIVWGGLRGAVTLALALALPVELEYWWTIQSMAFGVVLFTLFVQAPSMPRLLSKLGLTEKRS